MCVCVCVCATYKGFPVGRSSNTITGSGEVKLSFRMHCTVSVPLSASNSKCSKSFA